MVVLLVPPMHPISDAVPAALAALLNRQPLSPAKVDFAWRVAVGPALAHATEVRLDPGGTLVVTAADRHWSREVESARSLILPRMSRLLGPDVVGRLVVDFAGTLDRPAEDRRRSSGARVQGRRQPR